MKSLEKIVDRNRGGFCYELNFSFRWLLSSLGYRTRLAVADVGCSQVIPAHVIILVDGLLLDDDDDDKNYDDDASEQSEISSCSSSITTILVDVGFGDPGACDVLLPVQHNKPKYDLHGDLFEFSMGIGDETQNENDEKNDDVDDDKNDNAVMKSVNITATETEKLHIGRFNTALYRHRISAPDVEEPMYRFHLHDDMKMSTLEFQLGLERVLNVSPTFTTKRICVMGTDRGHVTLGRDYIKWVEKGESVKRVELPTETAWRDALKEYFGIVLSHDE